MLVEVLILGQEKFLCDIRGIHHQNDCSAKDHADDWRYFFLALEVGIFNHFDKWMTLGQVFSFHPNVFHDPKVAPEHRQYTSMKRDTLLRVIVNGRVNFPYPRI